MLKTKPVTTNFVSPIKLNQRLNKSLMLSSRQIGWKGILVEQYQNSPTPSETELPALSDHLLNLPLGHPVHLTQKRDDRLHESIVQKGDTIFVPAGQPSYWRCQGSETYQPTLHIHLKPELITQVAETSEFDREQINLVNCFCKQDLHLQHIAMLLLAELKSGGMMGQLYVESLTQVLVIHLLRHYSTFTQTITSQNRSLTNAQLQRAIDYIHTHLDRDLSLVEIAGVINISPTYFASLFKSTTGISPHQYVIKQRVEQAKLMLLTTDLAIADIALQVGFSSQSHLTQHFKRLTRMTPKQVR
ncbi:helix-turn-helix domain-containing protein [Brasilonema sennae]|jgi:AraC family transcriptional regulator|uniref:helix-turn-helix domain-containing protein n=1 Tax=Brasilonema sennae TaxID=1397703 RepID=UPI001FE8FA3A|nr:AraC family transcriptional regulator [Brasilonema sennae]